MAVGPVQHRSGAQAAPTERLVWSRPAHLPGLEIMAAEGSRRLWRVFHETYTVCTVLADNGGCSQWTYRGASHVSRAGTLMLMEPGELHAVKTVTAAGTFRVLLLSPSLVEHAAAEVGAGDHPPHFKLAVASCPQLFGSFARFHASVEAHAPVLEQETRLAACVRRVLEECAERPGAPAPGRTRAVAAVRDYIDDNYRDDIRLETLAHIAGLSRFHLARVFAGELGLPPHAYQVHVRVERARQLLAAGVAPSCAALQTGFCDQSHLTRSFGDVLGVTPARYAAMAGHADGDPTGPAWPESKNVQDRDRSAVSHSAGGSTASRTGLA